MVYEKWPIKSDSDAMTECVFTFIVICNSCFGEITIKCDFCVGYLPLYLMVALNGSQSHGSMLHEINITVMLKVFKFMCVLSGNFCIVADLNHV